MAQDLQQNFIYLGGWSLRTDSPTKLGFYHGKGSLHVGSLVIMGQEIRTVELVAVPHATPKTVKLVAMPTFTRRAILERDVRYATKGIDRPKVSPARVCLIRRHFTNREGMGRSLDKPWEMRGIRRFRGCNFYTSHDIRCDPTHQMGLDPLGFAPHLPPFVVKPSVIGGGGKARGVHREVCFQSPQGTGTFLNQGFEQWRERRVLQVVKEAVVRRGLSHVALHLQVTQVRHGPSARDSGVDLAGRSEDHGRQWVTRPSTPHLWGCNNPFAQFTEEFSEPLLFMGLGHVVGGLILPIGDTHRPGFSSSAVGVFLTPNGELHGEDVFAGQVAGLKVWAATSGFTTHVDQVQALPCLRRPR